MRLRSRNLSLSPANRRAPDVLPATTGRKARQKKRRADDADQAAAPEQIKIGQEDKRAVIETSPASKEREQRSRDHGQEEQRGRKQTREEEQEHAEGEDKASGDADGVRPGREKKSKAKKSAEEKQKAEPAGQAEDKDGPQTPARTPAAQSGLSRTVRQSSRRTKTVPKDNWLQDETSSPVLTRNRRRQRNKGETSESQLSQASEPQPETQGTDNDNGSQQATVINSTQAVKPPPLDFSQAMEEPAQPLSLSPPEKAAKTKSGPSTPANKSAHKPRKNTTQTPRSAKKSAQSIASTPMKQTKAEELSAADEDDDDDAPAEVSLKQSKNVILNRLAAEQDAIRSIDEKRKARAKEARERRKQQKSVEKIPELDPAILEELEKERPPVKPQYAGTHTRFDESEDEEAALAFDDEDDDTDELPAKKAKSNVVFQRGPLKVVSLKQNSVTLARQPKPSTLQFLEGSKMGSMKRASTVRRARAIGKMAKTFGKQRY
eukprot:m.32178 g.32178  ORF g.32178 m.32178 type:complete len:491 (+) comp10757_c0_seq1:191-1663(+)